MEPGGKHRAAVVCCSLWSQCRGSRHLSREKGSKLWCRETSLTKSNKDVS